MIFDNEEKHLIAFGVYFFHRKTEFIGVDIVLSSL